MGYRLSALAIGDLADAWAYVAAEGSEAPQTASSTKGGVPLIARVLHGGGDQVAAWVQR